MAKTESKKEKKRKKIIKYIIRSYRLKDKNIITPYQQKLNDAKYTALEVEDKSIISKIYIKSGKSTKAHTKKSKDIQLKVKQQNIRSKGTKNKERGRIRLI